MLILFDLRFRVYLTATAPRSVSESWHFLDSLRKVLAATAVPWASTALPKEARAGDGRQPAGSGPVGAEEGAQFLRVELGFFERREVPAARGLREPHEVGGALQPRPRRPADVGGELREAGGDLDPAGLLRGRDLAVRAIHPHR